ncbi:Gfo/Idh/MocA family oxidoreductase [Algoriphagus sp. NF]|jgi:predicted dehydrogenase|uniref:Gfo/Idh/MocA family oxidoreductase n=1 Tax=Algoriphagus marincola TaxID=264027 RepID=A0ABS7N8U1_9BACT|nr:MULTISPECIES: Gfo/Idh/MocA family oxidoreductase [Algoriphagus]MBY5952734.1 Gfo/Idh/MocA family oxidoreductase [Algoriphagus marincola]MDE0559811.1 Gfo/Idh/MocA family oxidoreductase [Algoriphagus sp. NF]
MSTNKKLKIGLVGGGPGSFIGAIHLNGALMDGLFELAAGAFSSNPEKSKKRGEELRLNPSRVYSSYDEMFEKELQLPEDERIDVVVIVTPNNVHFDPTAKAIRAGFHVVLDKPLTLNYQEAKELYHIVSNSDRKFLLTHTYSGYPMIKQAKQMIEEGKLGKIHKVYVEYPQGWLYKLLEKEDNKQAEWRTDPKRNGMAGCMGDIGTHAFHLAEYVSGQKVEKICADLYIKVEGRPIDDDGVVLMRFENGASGVLMASQTDTGLENNLKIRVFGDKGGIEWQQEDNNSLIVRYPGQPAQIFRAGTGYLGSLAQENTRTPAGHPEGYVEAFANLYRNFARCIYAERNGETPKEEWKDFPGIEDGIRGMAFIEHVLKSTETEYKWTSFVVEK